MIVTPIKTEPIVSNGDLRSLVSQYLPTVQNRSVVVITSKIVSILEGRVRDRSIDKETLIKQEAEYYIKESLWEKYHLLITRKDDIMIANAGIDESNANGKYILWPADVFGTATTVWEYLRTRYNLTHVGVLITDSRLTPLRWGTLGVGLGWCGFSPLNDYRGQPDIFGSPLRVTQSSVLDGLAAASVLAMGEGKEQTPIAVITDIPFVQFTEYPPTMDERNRLRIDISDDIYSPLIDSPKWQPGGQRTR